MVNNLTVEDLIALKLELHFKSAGTCLYGIPYFKIIERLAKEAVLKYAMAAGGSEKRAAKIVGLSTRRFNFELMKHDLVNYYKQFSKDSDQLLEVEKEK